MAKRDSTKHKLSQLDKPLGGWQLQWKAGKTPIMHVDPSRLGEVVDSEVWMRRLRQMQVNQEQLRTRIAQVEVDHPAHEWLQHTAARMQPIEICDFSRGLLESVVVYTENEAVQLPMPEPHKIPSTSWIPRKEQAVKPPRSFRPRGLRDLVSQEGIRKIERWVRMAAEDY